jgi:PKD repeat protein
MTKNYFKSLLLLFTLGSASVFAQSPSIYCGTGDSLHQELYKRADVKANMQQLEKFTQDYIKNNRFKQSNTEKIIIPMVFHIIYTGNPCTDPSNISKAQVLDAVKVINTDYAKLNADTSLTIPQFRGIAAKIGIEFRIATLDPNGKCTEGITRTQSPLAIKADETVKDLVSWDNSRYLNVWIVQSIGSGAGGYAFLPGSAPIPGHDGIVIVNTQFGSIGTSSAACDLCAGSLTHEAGHFFNLKHTWGSTNTPGPSHPENCSDDDDVTDTPDCIGAVQRPVCNYYIDTLCKDSKGKGILANEQNYMDYAGCYTMFTEGQKARILAAAHSTVGGRIGLWTQANLVATGTEDGHTTLGCIPVPDFCQDKTKICSSTSITFADQSYNGTPSSYEWLFPGGTPSTSTAQNPVIAYNTPGYYDATLIVKNIAGADTLVKPHVAIVRSPVAYYGAPFSDSFEGPTGFELAWEVVNNNNDNSKWTKANVGHTGTGSMKLNNVNANANSTDDLISAPLDFSTTAAPKLTFYTAYAGHSSAVNNDALRIYVSYNCGETWAIKANIPAAALTSFLGIVSGSYIPASPASWKMQTVTLNLDNTRSFNTKFKFEYNNIGYSGNNLYIDDISISGITGISDEIRSSINLAVYPNPTEKDATVSFDMIQNDNVTLNVTDIVGRQVYSLQNQKLDSGNHQIQLNTLSEKGVYFVNLIIGQEHFVKKLVIN